MASYFELVAELQTNIDALDVILSGDENATVSVGGESKDSISKAIKDNFAQIQSLVEGYKAYETLTELNNNTEQPKDELVRIWNDPVASNNAVYGWNGSSWVTSVYSISQTVSEDNNSVGVSGKAIFDFNKGITSTYHGSDEFNISGFILQGSEGGFITTTGFSCTDYIPIIELTDYEIRYQLGGTSINAWYDINKSFISEFGENSGLVTNVFMAPAGAAFVRVSRYGWPATDCFVRSVNRDYNINRLIKILSCHNPDVDASSVIYNSGGLNETINWLETNTLNAMQENARLASELDLLSDSISPHFINGWAFTRSTITPDSQSEALVVARLTTNSLQVESGKGINFKAEGSMVVEDATTNNFKGYRIKSVVGDVITVYTELSINPYKCQTMHDAVNGQHLSRLGYKGLADYIVDQKEKYTYKKGDTLFIYHPPLCSSPSYNDPNIWNIDNTAQLFSVEKLGGAKGGGYVPGSENLTRSCQTSSSDIGISTHLTGYFNRGYIVRSDTAGDGIKVVVPVNFADGFIELPTSAPVWTYISSADDEEHQTDCDYRVQVVGDDINETIFHDEVYKPGELNIIHVDFKGVSNLNIVITMNESGIGGFELGGIYAYRKSLKTSKDTIFSDGDVIAFLGDSWTQFPHPEEGEIVPNYPDGSPAGGMQFLSERMRERLANDGVNVTTLNIGRGGQTSAWGRHWVHSISELTPKPTHCLVYFCVNDTNSRDEYDSNIDSVYDFDPENKYLQLDKSLGGVQGSLTNTMWFENMKFISEKLVKNGIKPIILMPCHTASTSQSHNLQGMFLENIALGFIDE